MMVSFKNSIDHYLWVIVLLVLNLRLGDGEPTEDPYELLSFMANEKAPPSYQNYRHPNDDYFQPCATMETFTKTVTLTQTLTLIQTTTPSTTTAPLNTASPAKAIQLRAGDESWEDANKIDPTPTRPTCTDDDMVTLVNEQTMSRTTFYPERTRFQHSTRVSSWLTQPQRFQRFDLLDEQEIEYDEFAGTIESIFSTRINPSILLLQTLYSPTAVEGGVVQQEKIELRSLLPCGSDPTD